MSDFLINHPKDFKCKQSGKCCTMHDDVKEITLTTRDYERIVDSGRLDVLEYIKSIPIGEENHIHDGWFSPKTGMEVTRCPWLRKLPNKNKYKCRIYEVRPDVCRNYPKLGQRESAIKIGCLGWNHLEKNI